MKNTEIRMKLEKIERKVGEFAQWYNQDKKRIYSGDSEKFQIGQKNAPCSLNDILQEISTLKRSLG